MPNFLLGLIQNVGEVDVYRFTTSEQALLILARQSGQQPILDKNGIRG